MPNRREFLKSIPLAGAGLLIAATAKSQTKLKMNQAGLQLWTLRDDIAKDMQQTIKAVAAIGYTNIEPYGFDGRFYGMEAKAFRKFCADLGITVTSSHTGITAENADFYAEKAVEAGLSYLVLPSFMGRPSASIDDFKRAADEMNTIGEKCLKQGIRFGYHNHDFEFREIEGQIPYDLMLEQTDARLVFFQMDIGWMHIAKRDVPSYFNRYPGRFVTWHIKDVNPQGEGCIVGNGVIDYPALLPYASITGMEQFYVEQEKYHEGSPQYCAGQSLQYIRQHFF